MDVWGVNMNNNLRTGIIVIGLFIILLSPIILIHAHDVSAQYPNNASLSTGKATYALRETVCTTLAAAPEEIVFFNIISPTGIIYTALPSTDREYQFKPDTAGSYVVNVLLRVGDDETFLTTGFVVVDPEIVFSVPEQGEAVVGEPVNWSQHISVTNREECSLSNFSVSIPLPIEHSNLSSDTGFAIIDSSVPVDLAAGEGASFNISYQTPPVRLAVTEESISVSDLIPHDAFDIGVYKEIDAGEGGPGLKDEITVKQVKVWHNSSLHYHNIPVAIEAKECEEIVELGDGTGIVAEVTTERINETLSWTIPELSDRTYTVVEVTREQGDAEIGEPVEWQLNVSGTIVRYKTPAPFMQESKPVIADGIWRKEVVIGSNASVHYSDVTAYSGLGETEKSNLRLFRLVDGSRVDVTGSEEFDVSFSDTNGNGILDRVTWNVPMLSNQSFEVEADITVINVQSYPAVGGNWGVEFETVGCANLIITAVNGTTWSNADEEGDLQFLEIKCGDQTLDYEWINNSVFIENYSCNETGYEISKVLTAGGHHLKFQFGSDVEYAHNWASVSKLNFTPLTPANESSIYVNHATINVSIATDNLTYFTFNWNGTNYTYTTCGIEWNQSTDSYVRTTTEGSYTQSDFDNIFPWSHIRRCTLWDNGTVNYYLNAMNSSLKATGGLANLTGGDGQVMVEIPKFYMRHAFTGSTHDWEISRFNTTGFTVHNAFLKNGAEVDYRYIGAYEGSMWDQSEGAMVPSDSINTSMYAPGDKLCSYSGEFPKTNENRSEFRAMAAQRGAGWRQQDFDLISAVQLLYLIEYANFSSQSMIGMGRTERSVGCSWVANNCTGQCGKSNGDGDGTNSVGGNSDNAYMTYRGIENFYGNVWGWVDGINIDTNVVYVCNNDAHWADGTILNYTNLGVTLPAGHGYQVTLENIDRGFLPASVGGSSSTYVCDSYYGNNGTGWRVVHLGGNANDAAFAGAFCVYAYSDASVSTGGIGGRLAY